MNIKYYEDKISKGEISIFLAGPTPWQAGEVSWRDSACEILEALNFKGTVYIPKFKTPNTKMDSDREVKWEREALYNASIIVFWVPRNLKNLPGYTTNVEFGYWMAKNANKVFYGRPPISDKNEYLDWLYLTETNRQPDDKLVKLMKRAASILR